MRVVADELELGRAADPSCRLLRLTIPDRKTEFRVGGPGPHLVMGVHVNARVEAQDDLDASTAVPSNALEQCDLQIVVDGNETHAGRHSLLELGATLVVAMENHLRRIDSGLQPGVDLAARDDVETNPLLDQNSHQCWR